MNAVRLSLQNANDENQRKAGELSIIRARQLKLDKEHEDQLQALNKSHADDATRHKADLDAKKKEIEAYETSNRFLEHDLAQARDERAKRLKPTKTNTGKLTRQPSQSLPYRDGFDDNEIVTLSPSKPKDRSKSSTPKVGEKRKRNVAVSPAPHLQLNAQPSVSSSPALNAAASTPMFEELIRPQDDSQFQVGHVQILASALEADLCIDDSSSYEPSAIQFSRTSIRDTKSALSTIFAGTIHIWSDH